MANPNGAKGYRAERDVTLWAIDKWEIYGTDRLTKGGGRAGTRDRADVRLGHGTPFGVVVQVKDGYTDGRAPTDNLIAGWLEAVDAQVKQGGWDIGLLCHKRAGKASPNDWRWYVAGDMFSKILKLDELLPEWHHGTMPPYVQLQGYMIPNLLRTYGWLP